jgi:aminoglycoside phosphotransferase (APT) family kinase protein
VSGSSPVDNRGLETAWRRGQPFVALTPAEIEHTLVVAGLPGRVTAAEPLTAGLRNTNYRLAIAGRPEPVVLRLYTADPSACRREAALAELAAARGVPVPAFLALAPEADPPIAVTSWVDGVGLDELLRAAEPKPIEAAVRDAGRVLAAIHAIRLTGTGFLAEDLSVATPLDVAAEWPAHVAYFLGRRAGERLGQALRERLRAFVAANAAWLEPLAGAKTLVHGDYKPWNLLARRDGRGIAGVLDWEFAFAGAPLVDVAVFLRQEADLPTAYAGWFAEGYAAGGGKLPPDWRALARLLDLLNLCSMLDRPQPDDAFVRDARVLIEGTIALS